MKQYTYGIFADKQVEQDTIELVTIGLECALTANFLFTALLGDAKPVGGTVELIQTTEVDPTNFFGWHKAICQLCVPYFIAHKDCWPEDDWISLTPDMDLQLCSDFDSANNELATAYVYPVKDKRTDGTKGVLIFSNVFRSLDDFIKGVY